MSVKRSMSDFSKDDEDDDYSDDDDLEKQIYDIITKDDEPDVVAPVSPPTDAPTVPEEVVISSSSQENSQSVICLSDDDDEPPPKKRSIEMVNLSDEDTMELPSQNSVPDAKIDDEMEVNVIWNEQWEKPILYTMRTNETLDTIYTQLSKLYGIDSDLITMSYNKVKCSRLDTPDSLSILFGDLLLAHSPRESDIYEKFVEEEGDLELKFKIESKKDPFTLRVNRKRPIEIVIEKMKTKLRQEGILYTSMKVMFDGAVVKKEDTPLSLDMDDGDCFEVFLANAIQRPK